MYINICTLIYVHKYIYRMSFKLAVYLYLLLIRVTGAEPNPTSGWQGRLGHVIGPPQDTHADTHLLSHTHTLIKTINIMLLKMGIK